MSGRFLAVNGFNIPCRCQKVGTGAAPTAHLGDGCLDLVIIKQCSRFSLLRKLMLLKSNKNQRMITRQKSRRNQVEPMEEMSSSSSDTLEQDNAQLIEHKDSNIPHYDLPYVKVFRVKAFRFSPLPSDPKAKQQLRDETLRNSQNCCIQSVACSSSPRQNSVEIEDARGSLWCADGEALLNRGIFALVNRQLLTVYGCGPPNNHNASEFRRILSMNDVKLLQLGCQDDQDYIQVLEKEL